MRFIQRAFACLPVFAMLLNSTELKAQDYKNTGWEVYGGSKKSIRYSSLKQINTANVNQLQVAWV
jgi:glucose dehydrogenase